MRRIRYLTLLVLLLGSISTWAQNDGTFNPPSPEEPGPAGGNVPMLSLVASPADGGTVSGAGWYDAGTNVTLRAYNKTNFAFDHWENADGETVSTQSQFVYTKLAGDETLTAVFRFSPGSPAEPEEIAQSVYHKLTLVAEQGGSVSGGGKYLAGTRVYLSASVNTGFEFIGWYDAAGELVSSSSGFYYTTTIEDVTLTARFRFNPGNPSDPTTPVFIKKHEVKVIAEDGGTVNTGGASLAEGATIYLTATANTGYEFVGWYVNDKLFNSSRTFTYTMGTEDITFVARFVFNPSSPSEPSKPTTKKYAFYLMNMVTKPGSVVRYPIYLTSLDALTDISFQLTFPAELTPDLNSIEMSKDAKGYKVTYDDLGEKVYAFTLTGGTVPDGNIPLMVLNIPVPEDVKTAQGYQIKINQVSVTESNGTTLTASTRNGRISVYKMGDSNGDDVVNILDKINLVTHILGGQTEVFIEEVSNVNSDENLNIMDAIGIVEIILSE